MGPGLRGRLERSGDVVEEVDQMRPADKADGKERDEGRNDGDVENRKEEVEKPSWNERGETFLGQVHEKAHGLELAEERES